MEGSDVPKLNKKFEKVHRVYKQQNNNHDNFTESFLNKLCYFKPANTERCFYLTRSRLS
jgi:hypothetical protein